MAKTSKYRFKIKILESNKIRLLIFKKIKFEIDLFLRMNNLFVLFKSKIFKVNGNLRTLELIFLEKKFNLDKFFEKLLTKIEVVILDLGLGRESKVFSNKKMEGE